MKFEKLLASHYATLVASYISVFLAPPTFPYLVDVMDISDVVT